MKLLLLSCLVVITTASDPTSGTKRRRLGLTNTFAGWLSVLTVFMLGEVGDLPTYKFTGRSTGSDRQISSTRFRHIYEKRTETVLPQSVVESLSDPAHANVYEVEPAPGQSPTRQPAGEAGQSRAEVLPEGESYPCNPNPGGSRNGAQKRAAKNNGCAANYCLPGEYATTANGKPNGKQICHTATTCSPGSQTYIKAGPNSDTQCIWPPVSAASQRALAADLDARADIGQTRSEENNRLLREHKKCRFRRLNGPLNAGSRNFKKCVVARPCAPGSLPEDYHHVPTEANPKPLCGC